MRNQINATNVMAALTERALSRMGARAAEYVTEHSVRGAGGRAVLVPDANNTPRGVARTLTRLYGSPATIDRGEVAYWVIGGRDVEVA